MRSCARRMLAVALQAEVSAYIDAHAEEVDENGHSDSSDLTHADIGI